MSHHHWSIKTKLVVYSTISGVLALVVACTAFVLNDLNLTRSAKLAQLRNQAEILGFGKSAGLSLTNPEACEQYLKFLRQQPGIQRACLYSADGVAVASFPKSALHSFPSPVPLMESYEFHSNSTLDMIRPVVERGTPVGAVYLQTSTRDIDRQFQDCLSIAGIVILGSVGCSYFFSNRMQRWISRPILILAEAARRIERNSDYSVRVTASTHDEIGELYDAFNKMLDKIKTSRSELEAAQQKLEQRVLERTRQLQVEINNRGVIQMELVRAKEAAEAASRAKSEFLANMSHEIRTPLNAILGFTSLMRDSQGSDGDRREYLNTIHNSGQHLITLINDILDLSKIEAGQMTYQMVPASPHQVIAEVVSALRVRAKEKGLSLEYQWASQIPETIVTDPGRLRQMLLNIVGNGIKFTEQGGVRLIARLSPHDQQLVIDVIDTGIGIPAHKVTTIFEPFAKADNSVTRRFGGTGLGLSICRHIADALHGRITVQSEPGYGSIFSVAVSTGDLTDVKLLSEPDTDILYRNQNDAPTRRRMLGPIKVLAVDDGDTNRKLINLVLSRAGVDVETAEDGQQAINLALNKRYDLILMDMQMPLVDGYTATRRLREDGLTIPIVALTAHAMRDDEQRCLAAGCSGYLTKPIDPDRLIDALATELEVGEPLPQRIDVEPVDPLICALPLDDAEFLEIVHEFVERLRQRIFQMEDALRRHDLVVLSQLAHWLKGSGGTAGFTPLSDAARDLEIAIRDQDDTQMAEMLAAIISLTGRIQLPQQVLTSVGSQA